MLIADRDATSRSLISRLAGQLGFRSVAVETGEEALAAAQSDVPALVVIDVEIAHPSGYELCRELREQIGETLPIVFVSANRTSPQDEIAGLLLGADDYFKKPLEPDRFLARARRLLARAPAPTGRSKLTPREREVLGLLVDGHRTSEIAERLCITPKTAATHIDHILAKLGAHSQAQAVAFALRDGVVSNGAVARPR